ncbi:TIR domain-containing protein [Paenibacillus kandeliae]|uniref:TIR domain-containing protein n=1 Tax=Paenibacillus kandeliae TaxID=3231269 RepID=UPI0034582151
MNQFNPPVSVHFVWYPSNSLEVQPIFDYCFSLLSRDVEKPFSRSMNLPVYYRTSTHKGVPQEIKSLSQKNIVFIFVGRDLIIDKEWMTYTSRLLKQKDLICIPIALDNLAFKHHEINDKNFIRYYEFDKEYSKEIFFISITHEIYRYALNENFEMMTNSKDTALKLFLSHTKNGESGVVIAEALKKLIDNSAMRNFFDATDIAPGYRFDNEIVENIKNSTVIAIHTDSYSSRYWCQREIISAKDNNRPIIAVDSLEEFEDRRFPFATNIPAIHFNFNNEPTKIDLLKILSAALLETVRYFYAQLLLKQYKSVGVINDEDEILSRPPEVSDIEKILSTNEDGFIASRIKRLFYPEPPVYSEEINFLSKLGISCCTPLTMNYGSLENLVFGISISEPSSEELSIIGQTSAHLIQLSQDLTRHLISRGARIVYGGDLRGGGFTEFIFNESLAYQTRAMNNKKQLENYIAWPIYLKDSEHVKNWKASYISVAAMIELEPAKDVLKFIPNIDSFLPPVNTPNLYVWSRNLTEMRREINTKCNVRICAGGRITGYKGILPGILEEILFANSKSTPVYLLGGFGGVTASICESFKNKSLSEELTKKWQIQNNPGYKQLLDLCSEQGIDVKTDEEVLMSISNSILNNGLTYEENIKLFETSFIDEALFLVFKGLQNICK